MPEQKITSDKVLFLEGLTDKGFFEELLDNLGIYNVQIIELNGVSNFKDKIPIYLKQSNRKIIRKLALIRDADKSESSAFDSCKNILLGLNDKSLTSAINKKIKISKEFYPGNPSIGIYVLKKPDSNNGCLEDLLWKVVRPNTQRCIKDFLTCVNPDKSVYKNYSKNKIFAFLAAQNKGLGSIGVAAKKEIWKFETEIVFDELKHFLKGFRD
jgi:hypothetical protein